jgi:hypothetical protein
MTNVDELAQRIAELIGGEIVKDHDQHSRRIVADGVVVVVIRRKEDSK